MRDRRARVGAATLPLPGQVPGTAARSPLGAQRRRSRIRGLGARVHRRRRNLQRLGLREHLEVRHADQIGPRRGRRLAGSFPAPDKASAQTILRDLNGLAYLRKSYWLARAEQPDSASDESTYAKRESRMPQVAIAHEQTTLENRKGQGCDQKPCEAEGSQPQIPGLEQPGEQEQRYFRYDQDAQQ